MDSKQIFKSIQNSLEKLDKIHVFSEYTNVGKNSYRKRGRKYLLEITSTSKNESETTKCLLM